jgi:catechol 2,3-dioxygenase-like lactoylglutathione lyase family enzyme
MSADTPRAAIRYLFNVCNDVAAMRRFYVEVLGMTKAAFMDTPEFGYLALDCGTWQAMWFRADAALPVPREFAGQPGWAGGTIEATSWAVAIPEDRFAEVLGALVAAGAPLFQPDPEWRQDSYWGVSVLDPMGVTVEVYCTPSQRPATTTWPG